MQKKQKNVSKMGGKKAGIGGLFVNIAGGG